MQRLANNKPEALEDHFDGLEDTPLIVGVEGGILFNDTDLDADSLTAELVQAPANGVVTLNPDGSFDYTPSPDFTGEDGFSYRATDGVDYSGAVAVFINVEAVNDAPVATPQSLTVNEDQLLTGFVSGTDVDSDTLTYVKVGTVPLHGTASVASDGAFTYTPNPDFFGTDAIRFRAYDGKVYSANGTVSISVLRVNDAPSFVAGTDQTVAEDSAAQSVTGWATAISAGPADEASQVLSFVVTNDNAGLFSEQPAISADGTLTYTPGANANGAANVTVVLKDNGGTARGGVNISAPQSFVITLTPVNDAPVAVAQSLTVNEDKVLTGFVSGTDVDGDALRYYKIGTVPLHGTASVALDGAFTYTPNADFVGKDSFRFRAYDGKVYSPGVTVSITVNPVNDPPVAGDDSVGTDEDVPLTVMASSLLGNDTDVDGDGLVVTGVGNGVNGNVVLNGDGSAVFTPSANFNGTGSFEYTVSDGHGGTDAGIVNVTVNPVNDAPVAVNNSYVTGQNKVLKILTQGGLMNVSNLNAERLQAAGTMLFADFGAGVGLYGYNGKVWSFITEMDAEGMTAVATSLYVDFGTSGIYEYAGGALRQVDAKNPEQVYGMGSYLYADFGLGAGLGLQRYDGTNWIPISTKNAQGMTGVGATLYVDFGTSGIYRYDGGEPIQVDTRNPQKLYGLGTYLYADFGLGTGFGFQRYNGTVWTPISDMDAEGMTGVGTTPYVDFGTSGTYRYAGGVLSQVDTRNPQQLYGLGAYLYADFGSGTGLGLQRYYGGAWTVVSTMDVQGMAGAGTILYTDAGTNGVYRWAGGILVNDKDADGDALTAGLTTDPSHGILTLNADGSFTYTPATGFTGSDAFTYSASDGIAASNAATVTITVNPAMGVSLMAAAAPEGLVETVPSLTDEALAGIAGEVMDRWTEALNLGSDLQEKLSQVSFRIADLSGLTLGQASVDTIVVDVNAAGHGWYVDATPGDDLEFGLKLSELQLMATSSSPALGRMDLLTVVMHEMGHVLGFKDMDPNAGALMSETLDAGTRRLNDSTPESPKLVQMDRMPGDGLASQLWGTKDNQASWLEEFLFDRAGRKHNPFDPGINSTIKIKPFDGNEDN
jgi:VCBS repeat-containing protein